MYPLEFQPGVMHSILRQLTVEIVAVKFVLFKVYNLRKCVQLTKQHTDSHHKNKANESAFIPWLEKRFSSMEVEEKRKHDFQTTPMTECVATFVLPKSLIGETKSCIFFLITTVNQLVHFVHRLVVGHFDLVAQLREGLHGDASIHVGPIACPHFQETHKNTSSTAGFCTD